MSNSKNVTISRSVTATLDERFIFNFRLRSDALAKHLPVSWLQPQVFNGWSVASLCILKLSHVVIAPMPRVLGCKTISCAYRCGVLDTSKTQAEPSVYIIDRNTDQPLIAHFARWWLAENMPLICSTIDEYEDSTTICLNRLEEQPLFNAEVKPSEQWNSEIFPTVDEFAKFIHEGVSSYAPSIYGDALTHVDLIKNDPVYELVGANVAYNWLDSVWPDTGLIFDSAVRVRNGGTYKWLFRGLAEENKVETRLAQLAV